MHLAIISRSPLRVIQIFSHQSDQSKQPESFLNSGLADCQLSAFKVFRFKL